MKILGESLIEFYHEEISEDIYAFKISLFVSTNENPHLITCDSNTYFLLHIDFSAENQCEHEGNSFYKFDTLEEMSDFIIRNNDSKSMLDLFSKESILEFKKKIETYFSLKHT